MAPSPNQSNLGNQSRLKVLLVKLAAPLLNYTKQWSNVPLSLGYLAAMLYKQGFSSQVNVEILEPQINDLSSDTRLINIILLKKPHVLGFSLCEWNSLRSLYIAEKLKQRLPKLRIIVGGPEVTRKHTSYVMNCKAIDIGCFGEGEFVFIEILKHFLAKREDYSDIKGIFYRAANKIKITAEREPVTELDSIPSPYLSGIIKPQDYAEVWLETVRGCFNKCTYCSMGRKKLRAFSAQRTEREIVYLMNKNAKAIRFLDNDFIANPNFKSICKFLNKYNRDRKAQVHIWLQADHVNEKVIEQIKNTGIRSIEIGLQTTNLITLANIKRRVDLNKFARGVNLLKKTGGIKIVELDVMIGLPQDRLEDIKRTLNFCLKRRFCESSLIVPFLLEVLPNSELREKADSFKIRYRKKPPYLILESNYLSARDIKKALSLFCPQASQSMPNLVTYSHLNIFNEVQAYADNNSLKFNMDKEKGLITSLIFDFNNKFGPKANLRNFWKLAEEINKRTANPLSIWIKTEQIRKDLSLLRPIIEFLSKDNPFLVWQFILETKAEFSYLSLSDIERCVKAKEKINSLYKLSGPIDFVVIFPWPANFKQAGLERITKVARIFWQIEFCEKDNWRAKVEEIFISKQYFNFLLDFSPHSSPEFVSEVLNLIREKRLQGVLGRNIIFKNFLLNSSTREDAIDNETRLFKSIGSKFIFDKHLNLSYGLAQDRESIADLIEWQIRFTKFWQVSRELRYA